MIGVWRASYDGPLHTDDVTRGVAVRSIGQVGVSNVLLGQLGIIDVPAEGRFHGPNIGCVAV